MGLSTKDAVSSFEGGGIKITDGVYANPSKIKKVKDLSGQKIDFLEGKTFDLALEVSYDEDRFPQTYFGNLKTDASGEVTGWGGAFIIARIFEMAGVEAELDINNRFSKSDLKKLVTKEVYTISYTAGTYNAKDGTKKNNYKNWNLVYSIEEDPEELPSIVLEDWQRSRSKGYPSDYTLPINSSGSTPKSQSKSTAGKAGVTEGIDDLDDIDDDLPF